MGEERLQRKKAEEGRRQEAQGKSQVLGKGQPAGDMVECGDNWRILGAENSKKGRSLEEK